MGISNLKSKSFLTRFISGAVLAIITIGLLLAGNDLLFGALLLVSLIGMFELYRVFQIEKRVIGVIGYLAAIGYYALIRTGLEEYIMLLLVVFTIAVMAVYVFTFGKYETLQVFASVFGWVYVAVMMSYVYQIREYEGGIYTVWLVFLCSWVCDTCAYLFGVMFGKHKMAPVLSPKKSVEGAVGGVAGSAVLGIVYAICLKEHLTFLSNPVVMVPIICICGSIISMIGDLAASAIKRNHDIKDYGTLIPGHGGILDRFDSVIITAPIIYYLLQL